MPAKTPATTNTQTTTQNPAQEAVVPGETKRDKFKRLIASRMDKASAAILNVATLANKANYDFNEEDAKKIEAAFGTFVDETMSAFAAALSGKVVAKTTGFSL